MCKKAVIDADRAVQGILSGRYVPEENFAIPENNFRLHISKKSEVC